MKKLIIISGPTASGKTKTSLALAKALNGRAEIVNFDSLIFYKELNIGTAKPTPEELSSCTHHLINIQSAKKPLNASDYVELAFEKINELAAKEITPILVGGSAFYLRALIKGMYQSTETSSEIREEINKEYEERGIDSFLEFLKTNDPESLQNLHKNDHYRLLRAVEHFKMTGTKLSDQKKIMDSKNPYDFSSGRFEDFKIHHINLDIPKDIHWELNKKRTKQMIDDGLVEEVKNLLDSGFTGEEKPLSSIGYKETLQFLEGKFKDENEYMERISISTRQLAKSQRTFFNKIQPKTCYNPLSEFDRIIDEAILFIKE